MAPSAFKRRAASSTARDSSAWLSCCSAVAGAVAFGSGRDGAPVRLRSATTNRCRRGHRALHQFSEVPLMPQIMRSRAAGALLTTAIVGLTLATAYIHSTLGGLLFTLNALGYLGLAGLIVIGAAAPVAMVERFSWF